MRQASTEMVRCGNETDWKQVELLRTSAVGVKRGGSMWTWDTGEVYWFRDNNSLAPLVAVSRYPCWSSVCPYGGAFLALGREGTLCLWGNAEYDPHFEFNGPDPHRLLLPSRIHAREIADLAL
jgi:hypothetical protein